MAQFGNIQGDMNVFARVVKIGKDKVSFFTTSISSKDKDGEWQSAYLDVRFSNKAKEHMKLLKGIKTAKSLMYKITVTDGWLMPIVKKDGFNQVGIFVNDLMACIQDNEEDDNPF